MPLNKETKPQILFNELKACVLKEVVVWFG